VTQTLDEGLKREFKVVVPASDLDDRLNTRLDEIKDRVRINGFRPGKVPVSHLKRVYGRSVMAETIEALIRETNSKIVSDNNLRLAMEPKVTMPEGEKEVEDIVSGRSDLAYTVALEVVPKIELADFKTVKVEKQVAPVTDAEVDEALQKLAEQSRPYTPKADGAKAEKGDRLLVSFKGTIDGEAFEGGSGENVPIELGSGGFIPGFEEQLIGIVSGETRKIDVTFPNSYVNAVLSGKAASFEVTASSVSAPGALNTDDEWAKSLGMESLDKLKAALRQRVEAEHAGASRQKVKRILLDKLDELHKFDPPPTLLDEEFNNVWSTVLNDMSAQGKTFEDEGTTEEKAKEEYRRIANRRVRLGLVLAEIGEKNNIQVSDDEVTRAVVERARQFPGQEQKVWQYYRDNPQALASVRAPLYEEKVIDFLLELAKVEEKTVSREELFKQDEE
jgi:trigger factor